MTVVVHIGRRVPRSWFKRQANRVKGLMTFQENIWQMIKQSMTLGKKKCNASGKGTWVQTKDTEIEDLNYEIEWLKIMIRGDEKFEKEEFEDAKQLYKPFGKMFKKEMPVDDRMKKHFKSKILSSSKIEEAYKEGYGAVSDKNIANKLLEMGILTHVEWIKDFDSREEVH